MFGKRRDHDDALISICGITSLSNPYQEYNDKLLPILQKYLQPMKHTFKSFEETERKIQEEECLGKKSSTDIQLFTFEKVKEWSFTTSHEMYRKICKICAITPQERRIEQHFMEILQNKENLLKIKQNSFIDYRNLKITRMVEQIRKDYEGRKSDWALITRRLEVNGKMYALSSYLVWLYRDFQHDPIKQMKTRSIATLVHQDMFLIEPMLKEISAVFKQAMEWIEEEGLTELKNRVALLQYEFAHAMPFYRGSAAIGEWLEKAVYGYHGWQVHYNSEKMENLEALIYSLKEFVGEYDSIVRLEKSGK
ncbi:MAG: hypothetical protein Tsb0015_05490 [Simkaniaceae bacterium]